MKQFITVLLFAIFILPISANTSESTKSNFLNLNFTGLPETFLYPSYLADPLAVNSQITYRNYEIDEIRPGSDGTQGHFDITIGTRVNFFKISPINNPKVGIEMDWGMALTTFMRSDGTNFLDIDGIYYFSLAIKPNLYSAFRLTRHHICSHQGDQLDTNGNGSQYIDYDNNIYLNESNFVRDDYMISATIKPLHIFKSILPIFADTFRIYGDFNFYLPGADFLGDRANDPLDHSYIWYQYGSELIIPVSNFLFEKIYLAGQISQWQQTAFAKNYTYQFGIIFPSKKISQRIKFGYQFYDGQSLMNNYQIRRTKFSGLVITIDQ